MSNNCEITTGRGLSCKDAIGGIQAIYFFNFGTAVFTMGADDSITAIAAVGGGDVVAYKYAVKGTGNNLSHNINSDRNTGTTFFEQLVNASLKKMDATTNKEVKLMAYGNPQIVVHDNQGKAWLVGRVYGADLTGGTAVTGDAYGDLNGYTLVFTGNEKTLANSIYGSLESDPFADAAMEVAVITTGASTFDLSGATALEGGTFTAGAPLTVANYIDVTVSIATEGSWNIGTEVINGYRFEGQGQAEAGAQTLRLYGEGTPILAQTDNFEIVSYQLGGENSLAHGITVGV